MSFRTFCGMRSRRSLGCLLVAGALALPAAACGGGDDEPDTPSATVSRSAEAPTSSTTSEPQTPEEEVEAAYLRSWEVFATAMLELDPSGLSSSFAGEQLVKTTNEVEAQAADGRPIRVEVEHELAIQLVADDHAIVRDRYRNHSVYLDPETLEPTEPDPNDQYVELTTLRKEVGDEWKVVHIARESHSP